MSKESKNFTRTRNRGAAQSEQITRDTVSYFGQSQSLNAAQEHPPVLRTSDHNTILAVSPITSYSNDRLSYNHHIVFGTLTAT